MINNTLTEILKALNKDELLRLDEFISSPYFNKKSAVLKFWLELKKYAPSYDSAELTHESLYSKVFSGKEFNYGTMKNLIFDLSRLTENFLQLEAANNRPLQQYENLLEALLTKGLIKQFEKHYRNAFKTAEKYTDDVQYYTHINSFENMWQNYLIMNDRHYDTLSSITMSNKYLTLAYFNSFIINNYNAMILKTEMSNFKDEGVSEFIAKAVAYYQSVPVDTDFITEIYYNAFMLVYSGNEEHFHELGKLLKENNARLSNEQKYNFYVALANYCGNRLEDAPHFIQHEFETYRYMIENSLYSVNHVNTMDGSFYCKVSSAAAGAGEHEWALEFINKFRPMLEENVQQNYYNHAMAEYYLVLKDFNRALAHLAKISHNHRLEKLTIKTWQMMCFYELGYFEELRNMIDSTRHFIANDKKITGARKDRLQSFITFISRLMILKESATGKARNEDPEAIKREINSSPTNHKLWLKEKVNELN